MSSEQAQPIATARDLAGSSEPEPAAALTNPVPAEPTAPFPPAPAAIYAPVESGAPDLFQRPPKKRRVVLSMSVVVVVVAVLAATAGVIVFLGGGRSGAGAAAAVTPTPTATPVSTTVTGPRPVDELLHPGSLVKYLIPAPSNTHPVANPRGSHNVLTLKQDAAGWTNPVGRKWRLNLLEQENYRIGAFREWANSQMVVEVDLLGFSTVNNAVVFFGVDTDNPHYLGKPPTATAATNTPHGMVYYTKAKDAYGYTRSFAAAHCGDVVIEVWVSERGSVSLALTNILLHKQYERLCP